MESDALQRVDDIIKTINETIQEDTEFPLEEVAIIECLEKHHAMLDAEANGEVDNHRHYQAIDRIYQLTFEDLEEDTDDKFYIKVNMIDFLFSEQSDISDFYRNYEACRVTKKMVISSEYV